MVRRSRRVLHNRLAWGSRSRLLLLRARRDQAAVRFRPAEAELARSFLQRGAIVQALAFKRINESRNINFCLVLARSNFYTRAVNQQDHLAARGFLSREARGQLAQAPARDLFVQLGQLARDRRLALPEYLARVRERLSDTVRSFVEDQGRIE